MLRSIGVALAASLLGVSCGTVSSGTGSARVQANPVARFQRLGYVSLQVYNGNATDVRIYLVRGSTWVKVGTVGGFTVRRFMLSPAETGGFGTLTLAVETFGSRERHVAELLDFEPGQEIEWWIEGRLGLSTLRPHVSRRQ